MLDFTIEIICPATGDKSTICVAYPSIDELLWNQIEGNNGCDCNRSLILTDGYKIAECNSEQNQIEAYLIDGDKRILLDDIDKAIAQLGEIKVKLYPQQNNREQYSNPTEAISLKSLSAVK